MSEVPATRMEEGAKFMDGYDDCILGIAERYGLGRIVAYDKDKVIRKLMKDGMDRAEAEDFFYYNQIGAWVGEGTPIFIERMGKERLMDEL